MSMSNLTRKEILKMGETAIQKRPKNWVFSTLA